MKDYSVVIHHIKNLNMELYNLINFTTYAMVAGPGIYAKLQPNHYVMIWVHYTLTVGFWCQTIHKKFLRRFDIIFGVKMMEKSGREKLF